MGPGTKHKFVWCHSSVPHWALRFSHHSSLPFCSFQSPCVANLTMGLFYFLNLNKPTVLPSSPSTAVSQPLPPTPQEPAFQILGLPSTCVPLMWIFSWTNLKILPKLLEKSTVLSLHIPSTHWKDRERSRAGRSSPVLLPLDSEVSKQNGKEENRNSQGNAEKHQLWLLAQGRDSVNKNWF